MKKTSPVGEVLKILAEEEKRRRFELGKPRSISGRSGEEKKTRISRMTNTRTRNLWKIIGRKKLRKETLPRT